MFFKRKKKKGQKVKRGYVKRNSDRTKNDMLFHQTLISNIISSNSDYGSYDNDSRSSSCTSHDLGSSFDCSSSFD
ncbi:hypothetical protein [Bacillus sp. FSL K6-0067]|uniref:hypothetical protein n=1 Tax=Bacillus sp. FSL K6-0067 TaxID=2921412 RepID=UPI00077A8C36|nr:hypothetical protein [Bacillus cereus]KXY31526.1 hypothetical protein AT267_24365 [Bacillus cereus]